VRVVLIFCSSVRDSVPFDHILNILQGKLRVGCETGSCTLLFTAMDDISEALVLKFICSSVSTA